MGEVRHPSSRENGFGLIQVIVASAISLIIALGLASVFRDGFRTQAFIKMQGESDNFHEEVRALLSSREACGQTMAGVALTPGTTTQIPALKDHEGAIKYAKTTPLGDRSLEITDIVFSDYQDRVFPAGEALLTLSFRNIKDATGPKDISRTIRLETRKNAAGAFVDCIALAKMSDGIWRLIPNQDWDIFFTGGHVGIGTTSPRAQLEVAGSGTGTVLPDYPAIRVINTNTGPSSFSALQTLALNGAIAGRVGSGSAAGGGSDAAVFMASITPHPLVFLTAPPSGGEVLHEHMRITTSGRIGIGTETPAELLHVAGDARIDGCLKDASSTYIAGTCASDERLKKNIRPLAPIANRLTKIQPSTFDWRETGESSLGLIAQQVESVFPELVEDGLPKKVRYSRLPIYLLQTVREQQQEIAHLRARLEALERRDRE